MKMTVMIIGGIFLLLVLFIAWASYPWSLADKIIKPEIENIEPEVMVTAEENPSVIKVLTWNLGFLYGEGSEGPGYVKQDKTFWQSKLDALVVSIKDWQPDVICFQEIDLGSARSIGINQARYVALKAGYPFVAEAVSWDANYIPFPYWPLTRQWGQMRSGGAILSKYPIISHQVELLEKPHSNPWWYNLFYLHRYFQQASIQFGEHKFSFINLHLEAFDRIDRERQVKRLIKKIQTDNVDFITGDFNMVPTIAVKKRKFPHSEDDYENDRSFDLMKKSERLEVIPEEIYSLDETRYFTFPSSKPNRRLDYIFYRPERKMMRAEILPSRLSDHLPLKATFQIAAPKFNPFQE